MHSVTLRQIHHPPGVSSCLSTTTNQDTITDFLFILLNQRELKTSLIYEDRCDEDSKTKACLENVCLFATGLKKDESRGQTSLVYYESIKREPKIRGIKKCRCDERLKLCHANTMKSREEVFFIFKNVTAIRGLHSRS
jgi:hypothetical protein